MIPPPAPPPVIHTVVEVPLPVVTTPSPVKFIDVAVDVTKLPQLDTHVIPPAVPPPKPIKPSVFTHIEPAVPLRPSITKLFT